MKDATRILFAVCAIVLFSFACHPLFMAGIEHAARVASLTAAGILLVAVWLITELFWLLTAFGRWLFPPYGQVR